MAGDTSKIRAVEIMTTTIHLQVPLLITILQIVVCALEVAIVQGEYIAQTVIIGIAIMIVVLTIFNDTMMFAATMMIAIIKTRQSGGISVKLKSQWECKS